MPPRKTLSIKEAQDNFFEKIINATPEERNQVVNATSPEEVKKILSTALTTRIKKDLVQCVLDKDGNVYVSGEVDWVSEDELITYRGIDLFSPNDYQEIRTAFLKEIKNNPAGWEVDNDQRNALTLLKQIGKERSHHWSGFKLSDPEFNELWGILQEAAKKRGAVLPRMHQVRRREARMDGRRKFFFLCLIFFFLLIITAITNYFTMKTINYQGRKRIKNFTIFWAPNKNEKNLIIFDYFPTKEEERIFFSSILFDEKVLSKIKTNIFKTRNLLALVKYYESQGRKQKNNQFNEFLLAELKKFSLAETLTSENKAYSLVNANRRVDKIIKELVYLERLKSSSFFW